MITVKQAQLPGVSCQLGQLPAGDPVVPGLVGTGFVAEPPLGTTASRPAALLRSVRHMALTGVGVALHLSLILQTRKLRFSRER